MASGELLGKVTHFFDKINVAVIRLDRTVKAGESVHFLGRNTDFQQAIDSMREVKKIVPVRRVEISKCKIVKEAAKETELKHTNVPAVKPAPEV